MINTRARRITIIARVTMKDGMRKKLNRAPLTEPMTMPIGIQRSTPGNPNLSAPSAPISPAMPSAEPTERMHGKQLFFPNAAEPDG